jgi:hypothetical protein
MAMLREKLGGGLVDHSAGLGVVSGALFLGSYRVRPTLKVYAGHTWTGVGSVRAVLVVFSPTGCTTI